MASAVVSGRVEASLKERAERIIDAAGITSGEVIKRTWEQIVATGEVPSAREPVADGEAFREFMAFRASLPKGRSWLSYLDEKGVRDIATERYGQ